MRPSRQHLHRLRLPLRMHPGTPAPDRQRLHPRAHLGLCRGLPDHPREHPRHPGTLHRLRRLAHLRSRLLLRPLGSQQPPPLLPHPHGQRHSCRRPHHHRVEPRTPLHPAPPRRGTLARGRKHQIQARPWRHLPLRPLHRRTPPLPRPIPPRQRRALALRRRQPRRAHRY